MICPECKTEVANLTYCPNCGATLKNVESSTAGGTYTMYAGNTPNQSTHPMKWYKFLIYFLLFASAVLNGINGLKMVVSGVALDMIFGIVLLGMAALAIYARMRLAGYYKDGPKMLGYLYLANMASVILQAVLIAIMYHVTLNIPNLIGSVAGSAIMYFANKTYFDKRSDLFTKE